MNAQSPSWDNDEDVTQAAEGSTVEEIRAEAARIRKESANERSTVMIDLGAPVDQAPLDDDTEITGPTNGLLVEDLTAASTPAHQFDPAEDPTTVMSQPDELAVPAAAPVAKQVMKQPRVVTTESLIEGKAPPLAAASYWEAGQLAPEVDPDTPAAGKAPIPKWFIATSLLAVVMAVGLVLLILWAISGSSL